MVHQLNTNWNTIINDFTEIMTVLRETFQIQLPINQISKDNCLSPAILS